MKTKCAFVILISMIFIDLVFIEQVNAQDNIKKAREMMAAYEFPKAIELYKTHFINNVPHITDLRSLAECYINIDDTKSAMDCMSKVVMLDSAAPSDVLAYAALLKSEGKYQEAIAQYKRLGQMRPEKNNESELQVSACAKAEQWIVDPEFFEVSNIKNLNTENSDFGLIPLEDGYLLTSDRKYGNNIYTADEIYNWTGKPYLKLYYIKPLDHQTFEGAIKPVSDLNYKYHNGPGIYDENDNLVYFTRTKMVRVFMKPINPDPTSFFDHSTAAEYTNRLEIYSVKYKKGVWSDEKAFEYNKPADYSVGHPAINAKGDIMYFVSDMPGGYGTSDIYYCVKRDDDTWGEPKNAGNVINSAGKEVFPFLDDDGTLFFSSDGHPGMGGLDIFYATGSQDQWSVPENLKFPINSPKDDFSIYYTESRKSGYFSSNRYGGAGCDDIYRFSYSPPVKLILAITTKEKFDDNTTGILKGVNLKISDLADKSQLSFIQVAPGTFCATAACNAQYEISGTRSGYFASSTKVKTSCTTKHDTIFAELLFDKIVINKPIVLRNIYYDFDKWNIRQDAAIELDKLVKILNDNPEINVELGSHTDCRGSDSYNALLSQRRAESAVNYIISTGIDKSRIKAKGYGESVLINKCADGVECTEEEHQMNRRTEFKVTSYKGQMHIEN